MSDKRHEHLSIPVLRTYIYSMNIHTYAYLQICPWFVSSYEWQATRTSENEFCLTNDTRACGRGSAAYVYMYLSIHIHEYIYIYIYIYIHTHICVHEYTRKADNLFQVRNGKQHNCHKWLIRVYTQIYYKYTLVHIVHTCDYIYCSCRETMLKYTNQTTQTTCSPEVMHIFIYTYTHTYTHTHTAYAGDYAKTNKLPFPPEVTKAREKRIRLQKVRIHAYMHLCIYLCMHVCVYSYIHIYGYVCRHVEGKVVSKCLRRLSVKVFLK